MSANAPNRLNAVVNVAILATILILLFGPTGPLGRWYAGWQAVSRQRALVESSWGDLISQASVIANEPPPSDTLVMFTDYQCPFCRSVEPALVQAVAGGLAIALLHLPLDQIHPRAREAASVAVCAEEHGLGIRGTPAFVTKEGIRTGVDGLDSVLVQVGTTSRQ